MATVINTPASQADSNSWVGTIIGVLVVGFLLILFFAYGLPALRGAANGGSGNGRGVDVNVPDQVDLNVKQAQPSQPQ
jgi:hypothetical protein